MLNETLWSGGMAVLVQCYSIRGYYVVSALNINSTVSNVFNVSFIAMGSAIAIIIGQLLGRGDTEEAVSSVRKLTVFSVLLCSAVGVVMALFSPLFPLIYKTGDDVRTLAAQFIMCSAVCMPIHALANACYFTLRSGGKTMITVIFDSCFVWVIIVPIAFCLSRFTAVSIVPLYIICQGTDLLKCALGWYMIRQGSWIQNLAQ